jgi:hypothetical protein
MIANDPRSTPAVPAPDWVQAAGKKRILILGGGFAGAPIQTSWLKFERPLVRTSTILS